MPKVIQAKQSAKQAPEVKRNRAECIYPAWNSLKLWKKCVFALWREVKNGEEGEIRVEEEGEKKVECLLLAHMWVIYHT